MQACRARVCCREHATPHACRLQGAPALFSELALADRLAEDQATERLTAGDWRGGSNIALSQYNDRTCCSLLRRGCVQLAAVALVPAGWMRVWRASLPPPPTAPHGLPCPSPPGRRPGPLSLAPLLPAAPSDLSRRHWQLVVRRWPAEVSDHHRCSGATTCSTDLQLGL